MLLGVLLGAVIYDRSFSDSKFFLSSAISHFFDGFTPTALLEGKIAALEEENENLRLQIFNQSIFVKDKVRVYSSYPFNTKKEIVIAGGADRGVNEGDVVTYGGGILVGYVSQVSPRSSIVKTVFDPGLQMPVRVGKSETDALFTGGNELTLSLIPESAQISLNDIVLTASRNLPYGLEVGRIKTIEDVKGTQFKKAVVESSFNLQDLKNVTVRPFH